MPAQRVAAGVEADQNRVPQNPDRREHGDPVEVEPEELAGVREAAIRLISPSVHAISSFWQRRRRMPGSVAEIGRNGPCPCGSARKHKRCCGAA